MFLWQQILHYIIDGEKTLTWTLPCCVIVTFCKLKMFTVKNLFLLFICTHHPVMDLTVSASCWVVMLHETGIPSWLCMHTENFCVELARSSFCCLHFQVLAREMLYFLATSQLFVLPCLITVVFKCKPYLQCLIFTDTICFHTNTYFFDMIW